MSQTLVLDDTTVTFEGVGSVSLSGAGARRIIDADFRTGSGEDDTLTINNLVLKQGSVDDSTYGGAVRVQGVYASGDALVITDSTITENYSNGGGGGVSARDMGSVSITGSTFTDDSIGTANSAIGGALDVTFTTRTDITSSTFEDNYSQEFGGVAFLYNSGVTTLDGNYFRRNRAVTNAGALYFSITNPTNSQEITIENSEFSDNSSAGESGAIRIIDNADTVTFRNVDFEGNSASGDGGALHLINQAGSVSLNYVNLIGNQSGGSGGAVRVNNLSAPLTFTGIDSDGNHAQLDGGAVKVASTSSIRLTNSTFNDDTAVVDGGAIYFRSTDDMYVSNVDVEGSVTGDDGAMHLRSDDSTVASATVSILDSTFTGNRSTGNVSHGGGLTLFNLYRAYVLSSDFTNNVTDLHVGAGLYAGQIDQVAIASDFTGNTAGFDGGAVYAQFARTLFVEGGTFRGNTAARNGGGIFARYVDNVVAVYPEMQGNSAGGASGVGGAIYVKDSVATTIQYGSFRGNYAPDNGGAIYLLGNDGLDDTTILSNLTFTDDSAGGDGGSLHLRLDGSLAISDVQASGSSAVEEGGFLFVEGAGWNAPASSLSIQDSSFQGHEATGASGRAGALYMQRFSDVVLDGVTVADAEANTESGGAYLFDIGTTTIRDSSFLRNSAGTRSGGVTIYNIQTSALIESSTFQGNTSTQGAAGIYLDLETATTTATIRNSTFVGNTASGVSPYGGGIYAGGAAGSELQMEFITVTGNEAYAGGGVYLYRDIAGTITNSIVSGNQSIGSGSDVLVEATANLDDSYSLFTSADAVSGATVDGSGTIFGLPRLNGLADNGGPTSTMLPQWDSPAFQAGDPSWVAPPVNDQRGAGFPRDAGGRVSMGAIQGRSAKPVDPVFPPSAPREVTAVAGDAQLVVSWVAPASSGSFPVTTYQVDDSTGELSQLVTVEPGEPLTAVFDGLVNGQEYAFRVRALNGAGWGPWSELSDPVAPHPGAGLMISGTRDGRYARVRGVSVGLVGESVIPRVKLPGQVSYRDGVARPEIDSDGEFDWQRETRKKVYVYFVTEDRQVRSNRVIIRPRS